jgi:transcriptional regulator GlxA family with amidase domain
VSLWAHERLSARGIALIESSRSPSTPVVTHSASFVPYRSFRPIAAGWPWLIADEHRTAKEIVLERLLQLLLIEALRSDAAGLNTPGLLRGLADKHLGIAIRSMHENPGKAWTVDDLAAAAMLSRSVFFDRFQKQTGMAPMEYLLSWRMALAKDMLRRRDGGMKEIARRIGYGSASTFSVAFSRFVGVAPSQYVSRDHPVAQLA